MASRETLLEIARIAEEHDLIVISDEIYDRLVYGGHQHVCFASLPGMRKRTLLLGGFSKDYAMTGWRIGYACGPAEIMNGLMRIHQYTVMSAPTTAQVAAITALQKAKSTSRKWWPKYDRRRKLIVNGLNEIGLPTFEPKGAFYAFPKVSVTGLDDETFATRLLHEEHVAVVPGNAVRRWRRGLLPLLLRHLLREARDGLGTHPPLHQPAITPLDLIRIETPRASLFFSCPHLIRSLPLRMLK